MFNKKFFLHKKSVKIKYFYSNKFYSIIKEFLIKYYVFVKINLCPFILL